MRVVGFNCCRLPKCVANDVITFTHDVDICMVQDHLDIVFPSFSHVGPFSVYALHSFEFHSYVSVILQFVVDGVHPLSLNVIGCPRVMFPFWHVEFVDLPFLCLFSSHLASFYFVQFLSPTHNFL